MNKQSCWHCTESTYADHEDIAPFCSRTCFNAWRLGSPETLELKRLQEQVRRLTMDSDLDRFDGGGSKGGRRK